MRRIPYADALAPRLAEFRGGGVVTGESLNDLACRYLMACGNPGMIYEGGCLRFSRQCEIRNKRDGRKPKKGRG